jgi:predicted PurR-regulated permease PerM
VALTRSALEPKLVGKQLGLDPLVTLFALYAGYRIWGLGGMLISPLLAVAATQFSGHASGGNSAEK